MKKNMRQRFPVLAALLAVSVVILVFAVGHGKTYDTTLFQQKAALLREEALADWVREELGDRPAGEARQVVFLSVSDGSARAGVWHASGETLEAAWDHAVAEADAALQKSGTEPRWVKADLIYLSGSFTAQELKDALEYSETGFFYYGAAFDEGFETALLEAEMNVVGLYQYEDGTIDRDTLNAYLKQTGRGEIAALPEAYQLFRTVGWLCDEENNVQRMSASGLDYGRRATDTVDDVLAQSLVQGGADWLVRQQRKDGSIPSAYGNSGAVDTEVHAQALAALAEAYRLSHVDAFSNAAQNAAGWLVKQIRYQDNCAYLKAGDVYTLAGGAQAAGALALYMEVFQNEEYMMECRALANGVQSMLETSVYALDGRFRPLGGESGPDDDGVVIEALCRVYGLTGEEGYLAAAQAVADRAIAAGDGSGKVHLSVAVDLLSQYIPGTAQYYVFVLESAQHQLESYYGLEISEPAGLPLFLASYQAYRRMIDYGGSAEGFYLEPLLDTIAVRARRQVDGYLFPECALYWDAPEAVQGAFITREKGMEIRTAAVCQNIEGFARYCMNYERLVADGLPSDGA